MKVSQDFSKYFNGYKGLRSTNISPSESEDVKESVSELNSRDGVVVDMIHSLAGDTLRSTTQTQKT